MKTDSAGNVTDVIVHAGNEGSGINGGPFVDGAFLGFGANFNLGPATAGTITEREVTHIKPVEASLSLGVWSLLAGLLSIFGFRRFNNKK